MEFYFVFSVGTLKRSFCGMGEETFGHMTKMAVMHICDENL